MSENCFTKIERSPRRLRGFSSLLFFPVFLGGLESGLFDPDPGHTLRVIQSIGILLPLFAGLLRFTTNDQSDVNDQVNDYLLLGILGLVLAGMVAALAGVGMNVAGILRISLFFVLLTFLVIGVATVTMFRDVPSSINRSSSSREQNEEEEDEEEDTPMQESEAGTADSGGEGSEETDSTGDQKEKKTKPEPKDLGESME